MNFDYNCFVNDFSILLQYVDFVRINLINISNLFCKFFKLAALRSENRNLETDVYDLMETLRKQKVSSSHRKSYIFPFLIRTHQTMDVNKQHKKEKMEMKKKKCCFNVAI